MKKKYTIVTIISILIGVADFIFLGCVSDKFFSENAAFVLFVFFAVLLSLIVILKTTEKNYYNDAECWKPEKIEIPELNGVLFETFFKSQLIKNGFTEFSEYNDTPEKAGIQVFY
jgi:cell division protein FtsW (lipid II flippase)